jgi:hypothetical protein
MRPIILVGAVLALSSCTPAAPAALPADLLQAVRAYDEAQLHGDRAALERLLASDYVLVNSRGQVQDKTSLIADYTTPGNSLEPFEIREPVQRVWNDGAVLGGLVTLRGVNGGQHFEATLRFADVWVKRDGAWQVVFTEVTPIPLPAP